VNEIVHNDGVFDGELTETASKCLLEFVGNLVFQVSKD